MKLISGIFMLSVLMFALTGCSDETANSATDHNDTTAEDNVHIDVESEKAKESLLDFQSKITSLINQYDDDFKQFANQVETNTKDVSPEKLQALKDKAAQSSEELSNKLRDLEIPKELESYSKDLDQTLNNLADRFDERSKSLKTENANDAVLKAKAISSEVLIQFKEALGKVYDSLEIEKPNFLQDNN